MNNIKELQADVENFYLEFYNKNKVNKCFYQNYYGYKVFYSPFIQNAKIWIIGINPGIGYFNECKSKELSDSASMLYCATPQIDNEYAIGGYNVARAFQKLFIEYIGNKTILSENSVVTNLHFISTENSTALKKTISYNCISKEWYDLYWAKVKIWNDFLLKEINPKLILSFGSIPIKDYFAWHYGVKLIDKPNFESPHKLYDFFGRQIIEIKRTMSGIEDSESLGKMIKNQLKIL